MCLKNSIFIASLVVAFISFYGPRDVDASFWDGFPIISQGKSLIQLIAGDPEGAGRTQANFVNQVPIGSQVKSLVEIISGNEEAAWRTQKHFLFETLEPLADNTPILGHIKGGIHIVAGDEERGMNIIKGATTSTAMLAGGVIGGPVGAIAGGAASDGVITGIQSAVDGNYKPFGIVDYASHIDKADAGEHFDVLMGLGAQFAGGKVVKSKSPKPKFGNKHSLVETPSIRRLEKPKVPLKRAKERMTYDNIAALERKWTLNELLFAREVTRIPENYRSRLTPDHFRYVNDLAAINNDNCYFCSLAAVKGTTVLGIKQITDGFKVVGKKDLGEVVKLYQRAGFPETKIIFQGNPDAFSNYLNRNLQNRQSTKFTLAYEIGNESGHIVQAEVWKDSVGSRNILITDFQSPVYGNRFSTSLPEGVKTAYILSETGNLQIQTDPL